MNLRGTAWMVGGPALAAAVFLAAASLFPIRLDHRTLQHLSAVEGRLPDLSGEEVWFLSGENSVEAGRMATYNLRHLVFPDGRWQWFVPAANVDGPWWGDWTAVDENGDRFRPARPPPKLAPGNTMDRRARSPLVVCESREVLPVFLERMPELAQARGIVFLEDPAPRKTLVMTPPRNEFTAVRWGRLTLLLGAMASVVLVAAGVLFPDSRAGWWLGAGLGVFVGMTVQLWLLSFGWTWWPAALAAQWIAGCVLVPVWSPRVAERLALPRGAGAAVACALAVTLVVFCLRLDFDGDMFTHWLPMARAHYLSGVHDPAVLLEQGSMHAATYPPGFGSLIAMAMWCAALDSSRSLLLGGDTSLAILGYRIGVWVLNVALVGALAAYSRIAGGRWLWLAAVALSIGLFDTVRGAHIGAETLLFPMVGAGILALAAGSRLASLPALMAGVWVLGVSAIVKWEGALLAAAIGIPWLAAGAGVLRRANLPAVFLLIGIAFGAWLPALFWRMGLHIDNEFFQSPSLGALWEARREWLDLLAHGCMIVVKSSLWIPFAVLLPVAVILRFGRGICAKDLLLPAATLALFLVLVSIYVFSNWTTKPLHMDQSFDRLLLVPAFSAMLYFLETLAGRGAAGRAS